MANSNSTSKYETLCLMVGGLVTGAGLTYLLMRNWSKNGSNTKASGRGRTKNKASRCSDNRRQSKALYDATNGSGAPAHGDGQQEQNRLSSNCATGCTAAAHANGAVAASADRNTASDQAGLPMHSASCNGSAAVSVQPSLELFHFRPIGYLRSCFTTRNGTPRQPLLVTTARSRLTLLSDVPEACFEGLSTWSHVWILYVFHDNTEPRKVKRPVGDLHHVKGKVKVPRLNGEKVGLFATRTPHRPVPIGLSVAQVIEVGRRYVVLGGADIVDGSPVLDIKPYVPFCDSVPQALAPAYVKAEADEEPLAVAGVRVTAVGQQQLAQCWTANSNRTLYETAQAFIDFVSQVLSRDIRSLRQRLDVGPAAQRRNAASLASATTIMQGSQTDVATQAAMNTDSKASHLESGPAQTQPDKVMHPQGPASSSQVPDHSSGCSTGVFHVVLEGVDVFYDVAPDGGVIIGGASLDTALAREHAHKHQH